jgi:hypothetical protein
MNTNILIFLIAICGLIMIVGGVGGLFFFGIKEFRFH